MTNDPFRLLPQADVLNSPLVLVARTDAEAATMIDSNIVAHWESGKGWELDGGREYLIMFFIFFGLGGLGGKWLLY